MSRLVGLVLSGKKFLNVTLNVNFLYGQWTRSSGIIGSTPIYPASTPKLPGFEIKGEWQPYTGNFFSKESLLASKAFYENEKREYEAKFKKLDALVYSKDFYLLDKDKRLDVEDECASVSETLSEIAEDSANIDKVIFLLESFQNIIKLKNDDFYDEKEVALYIFEE